jgi:hypothetical protein
MPDTILTSRTTPNGPAQDGTYREDSQPNAAPTGTPAPVVGKPAFTPAPVPIEAQAQATRSAPSTPQGGDDND